MNCDILVCGGGTGGVAAAIAACRMGRSVILTEPTEWISGQFTSQAVPPDEHEWVEYCGRTATYHQFRTGVRGYYKQNYPLTETTRCSKPFVQYLNPGNGSKPVAADVDGDRVRSLTVEDITNGARQTIEFRYVLDATETGELLPMTQTEYVTGSEARSDTGEPHASDEYRPLNMQGVTHCFAMDYLPGEDHTIDEPEMYDFWRDYRPPFWPDQLFSWTWVDLASLQPVKYSLFGTEQLRSLWLYRRILDKNNFKPGAFASDIPLVNWPMNDYLLGPVFEVPEEEAAKHMRQAKQLSLSFFYWLQTEAPRHDGGFGFRGLRLRPDVMGTDDGLAKSLYIRESRRIKAEFTVKEQHIAADCRPGQALGEAFPDSVGISYYRIDIHPSTGGDNYIDLTSVPYRIPLGALIPVRMENLIPACKNIGTTHISNGPFRLHPTEWNVGEAAGALAAHCLDKARVPRAVRNDPARLREFQEVLVKWGFELECNPIIHRNPL